MKSVFLLLFVFAFSVLAHQDQTSLTPITPSGTTMPAPELMPNPPDEHPPSGPSNWKIHWSRHNGITQFQIGHLITCHHDDSSDSPINTYSTRKKISDQRKKH